MLLDLINNDCSEQDFLIHYNANISYIVLPKRIYGFIFNYHGINNIFINKYLSDEKKKYAILHELAHLELFHLTKRKRLLEFKLEDLEDEADELIRRIME